MPDPKNPDKNSADRETDQDIEGRHPDDLGGSEVAADDARDDDNPKVQGHQWNRDEPEDGRERTSNEEDDREAPEGDEVLDDPGTRGAVYGKGGKGIVERDSGEAEPDEKERDK